MLFELPVKYVHVKRHKCGVDVIGPFTAMLNFIEDGIADITGPDGLDYGVDVKYITEIEAPPTPPSND